MSKIAFVNICHSDYVNDGVLELAARAVSKLESGGISVIEIKQPVTNSLEAEKTGIELLRQDVAGVILFLGTWIECPVAMAIVREVEHLPLCLWGFPMYMDQGQMTSSGSYVSFAMFKGTMDRIQYRYKPVLGLPDNPESIRQVICFCVAASALQKLKRSRIGLVGYSSMGIYPGTFDHVFLRVKIGPEVEQFDSYTVIKRAEAMDDASALEMIAFLRERAQICDDVSGQDLIKAAKLYSALKAIIDEKKLQGINVKCQYEFSKEYKMVMCVPLSVLADRGVVASCEGDMLNTVSMMILNYISGQVVSYGDVINSTDRVVKLSSCGFIPYSMGNTGECVVRKFMPHPGFSGVQNSFVLRPGKVTVMRLVEDQCDYHIIYFTGNGLKSELRQGYMPALDVEIDGCMNDLIAHYSGQHYAIVYGDLSAELEDLANRLGIRAIRI